MDSEQQPTPESAYLTAMIIWAAMLVGLLMVAVVLYVIVGRSEPTLTDPTVRYVMLGVSLVMVLVGSVAGLTVRWWFMRQRDASGRVPIEVFGTGHIVSLAIVEGTAVASLVLMVVAAEGMAFAIPALIGMGVMVAMKPSKALLVGGSGDAGGSPGGASGGGDG